MCYLRRVRVLRPRVLSKYGYFHVHRPGALPAWQWQSVLSLAYQHARRSRWVADGRQRIGEARSSSRNVDAWWLYALVQRPVCSVLVLCLNYRINGISTRRTGRWRGGWRRSLVANEFSRRCGLLRPRGRRDRRQRRAFLCSKRRRRFRYTRHTQVAFSQFEGKVCFAQNVASA